MIFEHLFAMPIFWVHSRTMLPSLGMWTKRSDRAEPFCSNTETLHLQGRLFGGADVVRRSTRPGRRAVVRCVESFDCRVQAERHVGKLVSEGQFRPVGESVS